MDKVVKVKQDSQAAVVADSLAPRLVVHLGKLGLVRQEHHHYFPVAKVS